MFGIYDCVRGSRLARINCKPDPAKDASALLITKQSTAKGSRSIARLNKILEVRCQSIAIKTYY
jgi:hypothetical protein